VRFLATGLFLSVLLYDDGRRAAFDVVEATIPEMQRALAQGRVTSRSLVQQYLMRIARYDRKTERRHRRKSEGAR